jgi:hypothetical protein
MSNRSNARIRTIGHRLSRRLLLVSVFALSVAGLTGLTGSSAQAAGPPAENVATATARSTATSTTDAAGVTTTKNADGSTLTQQPVNAYGFRDSLTAYTPQWTGDYKTLCTTGGHPGQPSCLTYRVYSRTFHACKGSTGGLVQNCMDGKFIYSAGYAVCLTTCTIIGNSGYRHCQVDGSDSLGYNVSLSACWDDRFMSGTAAKAVETDKVCNQGLPFGVCSSSTWHVNMYYTGTITGPYSGPGSVS